MKKILKKLLPEKIILIYHYFMAVLATVLYGFPSKKMVVIGITGTKGKTSTANFIWACLTAGGHKTGILTTANIRVGETEILNKYHMTMPGCFTVQKLLAQMVKEGCKFCVVETTSEGIKQYRNVGVYYDIAIFTNLSPEHLPSHGGNFENYRNTKGKMFASLLSLRKTLNGKKIEKIIIANQDSEHAQYFLNFLADRKITFGIKNQANLTANNILETNTGVRFEVKKILYNIEIIGKFNIYNALPAIVVSQIFNITTADTLKGLTKLTVIPGRMEKINEGQNFTALVDYAHEKQSITNVLKTANTMKIPGAKTIILLGAEGGGRDKTKRPEMGELSGKMADFVIVSNVDPYEDDPKQILEDIAISAEKFGKVRNQNLFVIEDRKLGIKKALSIAGQGDVVLITGKGAEQSIIIGKKSLPWDDRVVVREELKLLLASG